jgi:hypothetical protein
MNADRRNATAPRIRASVVARSITRIDFDADDHLWVLACGPVADAAVDR